LLPIFRSAHLNAAMMAATLKMSMRQEAYLESVHAERFGYLSNVDKSMTGR